MYKTKISIVLATVCIFMLCPQQVKAGTASNVADKTIECTAKGAYYVTKYTLKGGWFLIKKTAKGVKIISTSIFKATRDAFESDSGGHYIHHQPVSNEYDTELPPPPPLLD